MRITIKQAADVIQILPIDCMTEKEYNECVNLYADNVYRFIVKNLRHEEDAKDVVQSCI